VPHIFFSADCAGRGGLGRCAVLAEQSVLDIKQATSAAESAVGGDAAPGGYSCGNADGYPGGSLSLWYVLHTRSRQEKALADDLQGMGVSYFLPLVSSVRYYGRRKATVETPLFPGYVFLRGTLEEVYEADRTRRVANIIKVADQKVIARELSGIRDVLGEDGKLDPHPYLQRGVWVEVRSGPFKGVVGVVEDRKVNRLILQIQVLGQASSLEIDGALLEPIAAPAVAV
jgi:transcriptional antiterminator NusG